MQSEKFTAMNGLRILMHVLRNLGTASSCGGRKFFTLHSSLFTLLLFFLTSCQYKDLCYDHPHGDNYNLSLLLELQLELDVNVEVSVETHTKIEKPDYMKVMFYNPQTGMLSDSEIISSDGGRLYEAPNIYDMLVYSFGTEWTQIRGVGDINTLEAFTSDITATKSRALRSFTRADEEEPQGPIIYTPDHLLVAHERVEIPPFSEEERVITLTANARTVVETYGFQIINIKGIEYISSVEAFVTNQSRSTFFGRGEKSTEPATIYFPIEVNNDGYIHTAFNTFGKLPGVSRSYLHILIKNTSGEEVHVSVDITDQFEKEDHEIIIDEEIDIPKPESGGAGIAPTVDPWNEENHDVPIG